MVIAEPPRVPALQDFARVDDPDRVTDILALGVRAERLGLPDRAIASYRQALGDPSATDDNRAEALRHLADVHRVQSRWEEALEMAHQSHDIASANGLRLRACEALNAVGCVHHNRGDMERALEYFRRAEACADNDASRATSLKNQGAAAAALHNYPLAKEYFLQAGEAFRSTGDLRGEAMVLNNLGRLLLDIGDEAGARAQLRHAIRASRDAGDLYCLGNATLNYAEACMMQGDTELAITMASSAVGHFTASGNQYGKVEAYRILGDIHRSEGDIHSAESVYRKGLQVAIKLEIKAEEAMLRERLSQAEAELVT